MPSARRLSASVTTCSTASSTGSISVSCEPIWLAIPAARSNGCAAMTRYRSAASSSGTPNLFSLSPVEMYGWVLGSTSGLTRNARLTGMLEFGRDLGNALKFAARFDIDAAHPGADRAHQFSAGFANAREDHVRGARACRQHALEFAARDDVEARAEMLQDAQDGKVVIGLHRVMHTVATRTESRIVGAPIGFELLPRIDIARRAERRRRCVADRPHRHAKPRRDNHAYCSSAPDDSVQRVTKSCFLSVPSGR